QAEDGIRDRNVTGVQTCALPICRRSSTSRSATVRSWVSCVGTALSLLWLFALPRVGRGLCHVRRSTAPVPQGSTAACIPARPHGRGRAQHCLRHRYGAASWAHIGRTRGWKTLLVAEWQRLVEQQVTRGFR